MHWYMICSVWAGKYYLETMMCGIEDILTCACDFNQFRWKEENVHV